MAKSSIHIQAGQLGVFQHNDRSRPTKNTIFHDEKSLAVTAKDAFKIYREELAFRSAAYKKRTGQRLQKKAITHLSAIVNLEQRHGLEDIKKIAKHLAETLDTRILQVAIHRDEGHIDENGKAVKNYHAHIEMMGLDSGGGSVRKKLTKGYLSGLQDFTAAALGMDRGHNYAREQRKRPKRLDTYEYKEAKKREEEAQGRERARLNDLKAENSRLRAELKAFHAQREQYAMLEGVVRSLREEIRAKELTIEDMHSRIEAVQEVVRKSVHPKTAGKINRALSPAANRGGQTAENTVGLERSPAPGS